MSQAKKLLPELGLFLTAIVWGSTFFIVKKSITSLNPLTLVAYRFGIAALILSVILVIQKKNLLQHFHKGLALGLLMWLTFVPQAIGLTITSAANSGFITGTFVIFIPIFSLLFFHIKTSANKWASVILSLIGLAILTGGFVGLNIGDLLTLVAAMACAAHILFADRFVNEQCDPLILAFQQFFCVSIITLLIIFLFNIRLQLASADVMGAILYLALFPSLGAYVIQLIVQKTVSPVRVSLWYALEPVFGAIFAWTLGQEKPTITAIAGGVCIVLALVIAELPFKKIAEKLEAALMRPPRLKDVGNELETRQYVHVHRK